MTAEFLTWLSSWWTGSALQVGILVSAFWLALMVAILALVSGNRRGRDLDMPEIRRASRPAPLELIDPPSFDRSKPVVRVRGLS